MNYSELAEIYDSLESTSKRLEKTYIISNFLKKTKKEDIDKIILLLQGRLFPLWDETTLGVSDKLVIKAISVASGTSTDKIQQEWKKIGDLGRVAEKLLTKKSQATLFSADLTVQKVFDNLRKLPVQEGHGSVDQKVKLMAELLSNADPLEARYVVRTALEDLRVGVGSGSIRDAIVWAFFGEKVNVNYDEQEKKIDPENREEYNKYSELVQEAFDLKADFGIVAKIILEKGEKGLKSLALEAGNPLNVMLYKKVGTIEEAFERVGKPCAFEYKYDGFRCITGNTPIFIKRKGLISVKDVKKGDFALTHKGNFKKVVALNKRVIDKKERLFKITSYYGNEFRISEKHPLLIYRNNKKSWVNVENVSSKDNLVFPKPFSDQKTVFKDDLFLCDNSGYSKRISLNNFFFRFLGYWIGDGFTNNYHNTERVGLVFNAKKDKELCNFYERNIKKHFQIVNISRNLHNGGLYLYWRDKPFRQWLSEFFRIDWKGKNLPEWFVSINKKQFDHFLKGWIESDGHTDKLGRTSITTKERTLAMMCSLLGIRFGRMIGIKKIRIDNKTYYRLMLPKSKRGFLFKKDFVLVNIKSIEEVRRPDPRTTLYNMQVEGDESYCTTMLTLHNCQIHKNNEGIKIFTRRLDDVTKQFPEVVEYVSKLVKGDSFILDTEAVGFDPKTEKYLPFQSISQRIRRKYDIHKMAKDFPVEINVFDIIEFEGKNLLKQPFIERRNLIENLIKPVEKQLVIAKQLVTADAVEANAFYQEALNAGEEGVMAKNLEGIYKPGSRVGYGVKVKPVMEPLDLVIVKAEWGTGKRSGWFTSFTLACRSGDRFLEIGKFGTGLKELDEEGVSFNQMSELLKPHLISEEGKEASFKPAIIIEVNYEEIQKSPTYSSGYALRFPRFIRLRDDKPLSEVSDINLVEELYDQQ